MASMTNSTSSPEASNRICTVTILSACRSGRLLTKGEPDRRFAPQVAPMLPRRCGPRCGHVAAAATNAGCASAVTRMATAEAAVFTTVQACRKPPKATLIIPFGGIASLFLRQSRTEESTSASKKSAPCQTKQLRVSKRLFNQRFPRNWRSRPQNSSGPVLDNRRCTRIPGQTRFSRRLPPRSSC